MFFSCFICTRWSHVRDSLISANSSLIWYQVPFPIWIRCISFSLYRRKALLFVIRYDPGKFLDRDVGKMRDYYCSTTSQATPPFLWFSFVSHLEILDCLPGGGADLRKHPGSFDNLPLVDLLAGDILPQWRQTLPWYIPCSDCATQHRAHACSSLRHVPSAIWDLPLPILGIPITDQRLHFVSSKISSIAVMMNWPWRQHLVPPHHHIRSFPSPCCCTLGSG